MVAVIGGSIAAAGALGSAAISSSASKGAAGQQVAGAEAGTQELGRQYDLTRGDLLPYNTAGQSSESALLKLLGLDEGGNPLTAPLSTTYTPFTPGDLSQTPGYQFTLAQGLKATQNGFAAKGLASSGAAEKGAGQYATGLADSTYLDQLKAYISQYQAGLAGKSQTFNQLSNLTSLGEDAGAKTGAVGGQAAQGIANLDAGIGNANAAGTVGTANALSGSLGSLGGIFNNSVLLQKLLGGGASDGGGTLVSPGITAIQDSH